MEISRNSRWKMPAAKVVEMLVLSRKKNQSIMIGENIEIKIICLEDNQVRLGITAPRRIPVHREEVYQIIQNEKLLNHN